MPSLRKGTLTLKLADPQKSNYYLFFGRDCIILDAERTMN